MALRVWLLALVVGVGLAGAPAARAAEHACGNRPATAEEQAEIDASSLSIDTIAPNALARARAAAELASPRAGGLFHASDTLPTAVDNSTLPWFPPIGNQGGQGSCTAWASAYYTNTFTQAKDEGYTVSGGDTTHLCSPAFLYPLTNGGADNGANLQYAMLQLAKTGASSLALMPYSDADWTTWPSEAAWIGALPNRTQSIGSIVTSGSSSLTTVKQFLANGNIGTFSFDVYSSFDAYPSTTNGVNNGVYYAEVGTYRGGHAVTVIGYDDAKSYVDHRDGLTHYGAFLVANSWGHYWGVVNSTGAGTKGYVWFAYTAFLDGTVDPYVNTLVDRPLYRPSLYAAVGANHAQRGRLSLTGGALLTPTWYGPYPVNRAGGSLLALSDTARLVVDLSDGVSSFPTEGDVVAFVEVDLSGSASTNATITSADFYEDLDGDGAYREHASPDPVVTIAPGAQGYAYAHLRPHALDVTIAAPAVLASGVTVSLSATSVDTYEHSVATWAWSDGGAGGTFSPSSAVANPSYTAPTNATGMDGSISFTVTGTCASAEPATDSDSVTSVLRPQGVGVISQLDLGLFASAPDAGATGTLAISEDGRYVAFASAATNLVADYTPTVAGQNQVYVLDRQTGDIEMVSVSSAGVAANAEASSPSLSREGRFVAFTSGATNLVDEDTNGVSDIFLRDRTAGATTRVSLGASGVQADGASSQPALSGLGRFVAFTSEATNLISGDTNGLADIFRHDTWTGLVRRVSVSTAGAEADTASTYPTISGDGRFLAYTSRAATLDAAHTESGSDDVFLHDGLTGVTQVITSVATGSSDLGSAPSLSWDGHYLAYVEAVTAGLATPRQVTVYDRLTGERTNGTPPASATSATGECDTPSLSTDGRTLVFRSNSTTLGGAGDLTHREVFARDLWSGATTQLLHTVDGLRADDDSGPVVTTRHGQYAGFLSAADNLLEATEDDLVQHVFLWARGASEPATISGAVTAVETGLPLAGVVISCAENSATTDAGGAYSLRVPGANTYRLVASLEGYLDGLTYLPALADLGTATADFALRTGFADVADGFWAHDQVAACVAAGIVGGYPEGYRPADTVTRDQMAVFIARALVGGEGALPDGPSTASFADVPTDFWAFKHIEYLKANLVVAGYADGYHPADPVTRAQMAVYLSRALAGGDAAVPTGPTVASFADVPSTYWAFSQIEFLKSLGLVSGYSDGYHPEDAVTRDQMAVYIARAFHLLT